MYILMNVPRLVCYGLVLMGMVLGDCPWWVPAALVCYDVTYFVPVRVPWKKPPAPIDPVDKVTLQQFMQLRATMEKQNGGVNH